ncbi:MAG: hypothetical protein DRN06_07620 [Thermoprotei archaeon]|nr:MAG: hypothetical protein DRN06_07620 [Thermoprotei archaeon]
MAFITRRRGVSDIITNLLMAVVVLSVGLSVYMYSTTQFQTMSGAMDRLIQSHERELLEKFIITKVFLNTHNDTITVVVYNYGGIDTDIRGVFINGILNQVDEHIPSGEWRSINVPYSEWAEESYRILVVSSTGTRYEVEVEP